MNDSVAVITINYNHALMTIECVDSILSSSVDNFKIYLIDNGSKMADFQQLVIEYTNNKLVELVRIDNNCGYVGGVNIGLKIASQNNPNYYLIMNNDTIIDPDAIKILKETAIKHNDRVIVTGTVLDFYAKNIIQTTGSLFSDKRYLKEHYPYRNEDISILNINDDEERELIDDIFWMIPNNVFIETGFYSDCYFLYAEQADYALCAVRKGFKLIYTPKAKLWHKGSQTTGNGDRNAPPVSFWKSKSAVIYLYRNIRFYFFIIKFTKLFAKDIWKIASKFTIILSKNENKANIASLFGLFYGLAWIFHRKPDNGYNPFTKK